MEKKNSINNKPLRLKSNFNILKTVCASLLYLTLSISGTEAIGQNNNKSTKNTNFEISNQSILNHNKLISLLPEEIFGKYGEKEGLKLLQKHTLEEINKIRKVYKLQPLALDSYLSEKGQDFITYQASQQNFSHFTKNGIDVGALVNNGGKDYLIVKDNMGMGILTIENFIKNQMGSLKHKNTIIERDYDVGNDIFDSFGFGYKDGYRIMVFGKKKTR